jgi:hypothetical protein
MQSSNCKFTFDIADFLQRLAGSRIDGILGISSRERWQSEARETVSHLQDLSLLLITVNGLIEPGICVYVPQSRSCTCEITMQSGVD